MLTVDQIEKLCLLDASATPGPWEQSHRHTPDDMYSTQVYTADGDTVATLAWYPRPIDARGAIGTYRQENAELIVAMRNRLPDILALAEQSKQQRSALIQILCAARAAGEGSEDQELWLMIERKAAECLGGDYD
jgi:hypothetical protein